MSELTDSAWECMRTIEPTRALAAEAVSIERKLRELINQAYARTPTEIELRWQTATQGIAILARRCYRPGMKTLTMKLPEGLLSWLEHEAKRAQQPKSALVREILQQHQQRQHQSALDLAADLCGCVQSGLRDLSRNKKHLKGFGR